MSSSSIRPVLSKSNASTHLETIMSSNKQATVNINVTDSPTYSLDRYLGHDKQTLMDQQQRPPPEVEQTRNGATAETEAKERMLALLREFDEKFGSSGNSSTG